VIVTVFGTPVSIVQVAVALIPPVGGVVNVQTGSEKQKTVPGLVIVIGLTLLYNTPSFFAYSLYNSMYLSIFGFINLVAIFYY